MISRAIPKLTVAKVPAPLSDSQESKLAHELREGSGALRDETHPADSNFLQTETRERQMSIDVHPSLRRCLEKKSNSQDHRNEKTRSRRYEKL